MPTDTQTKAPTRAERDNARLVARNIDSIKIKKASNGYIVQEIDVLDCIYPELGQIAKPEGDFPLTVGEHIWRFFNRGKS